MIGVTKRDKEVHTCGYCAFWQESERSADIGECRKNTPLSGREYDNIAYWPRVQEDMWCGEFRSNPVYDEKEDDE